MVQYPSVHVGMLALAVLLLALYTAPPVAAKMQQPSLPCDVVRVVVILPAYPIRQVSSLY